MPGSMRELPLRHAAILGLLHGPTELLPISSSAHTTLVPWLAGWPYGELDPRLRKSFEVALHTGTALALLLRPPHERQCMRRGFLVAALAPPAVAGYVLGGQIEQRLGTPAKIVAGLLAGSAAMGSAEVYKKWHAPRARGGHRHFGSNTAPAEIDVTRPTASDGLALGVAQALALIPGVSRSGATLAAASARGFSRQDADQLSWTVGLPVIAGATLLQGRRLAYQQARADRPRKTAMVLAVGATSAFLSTLASSKALNRRRRARLLPACIAYRGVLAAYVIRHMRDNTC
ncbi:MAG TPA: undecaprenyl-diphosphate phosphatase [Solirubrobacteraceae bacterium]|jgi:undecaprenyl-diphosphatase|nr:undecaprenyl-diphosphate phosphatase [Solirubrobacteraceae bacterium]